MAKVLLVSGDGPVTTTAGATQYLPLSTCGISLSGTSTNKQIIFRTAGVLSNLYIRVTANTTSLASSVFVRNNGSPTTMTVPIPISTSGVFEDISNTVTVAAGDKLDYRSISGGTGTLSYGIMSTIFAASTDTVSRITAGQATGAFTVDSTTRYTQLVSTISPSLTSETIQAQTRIPKPGIIRNLAMYISANARLTDTTIRVRINAANSTITIPVSTLGTGFFEDITHSDSVVAGDLVNYAVETLTGAAESLTVQNMSLEFASTQSQGMLVVGLGSGLTQNANLTYYFPIGGRLVVGGTIEADKKLKTRQTFAFSALSIYVTTNGVSDPSSLIFRKNGTDSTLSVPISGSTTGYFDNLTTVETCNDNDEVCFQVTTGATGTSLVLRHISIAHMNFSAATKAITDPTITISETRNRMKAVERLQP